MKRIIIVLKQAFSRIWTHIRPWILRYSLSLGPALIFSFLITLSLRQTLSQPYISRIFEQRNIDIVFDALLHIGDSETSLLLPLIMTVFACLVFLPVQIAFIWLEGGTLFSYTSAKPISWKDFHSACSQWFGFMLLISSISTLFAGSILIISIVIGLVARVLWSPLIWGVIGAGVLFTVCFVLWLEIVRAVAVVRNERHLGRVLRYSSNLTIIKPLQLISLIVVSLASMTVLLWFQRWVSTSLPISWWLLSFVLLQALAYARHGVRLFRQSGGVVLAQFHTDDNTLTNISSK